MIEPVLIDRPVDLWSIVRQLDHERDDHEHAKDDHPKHDHASHDQVALLENPLAPSRLGRMSYLGLFPQQELSLGHDHDPAAALSALAEFTRPRASSTEARSPFSSGVIGYLAYELLHGIEPSVARSAAPPPLGQLLHFVRFGAVIAVDSQAATTEVCAADSDLLAAARELAIAAPDRSELSTPSGIDDRFGIEQLRACGLDPLTAPDQYLQLVEGAREQIAAGRLFELCLSQEFRGESEVSGAELFSHLRELNPAPMSAFIRTGALEILCSSPERLVSVCAAGEIETRPIKGTRPRSSDPAVDRHLAEALAASPKDRAENTMIVDVARNDLGRVCLTGSVAVPELCVVESYASVHHLVSTVRGQLAPGVGPVDVVRACFPGGSMTGAPKVEAMRSIAESEHSRRGIFSGAIGWIGDDGAIDLNIVIRTLIKRGRQVSLHTGGAVTYDSDPAAEYAETMDKARASAMALSAAARPARVRG